jgi:hypothetical protein
MHPISQQKEVDSRGSYRLGKQVRGLINNRNKRCSYSATIEKNEINYVNLDI